MTSPFRLSLCVLLTLAACSHIKKEERISEDPVATRKQEVRISEDPVATRKQEVIPACEAPTHAKCWELLPSVANPGGSATSWNKPHYALRPNSPSKSNLVLMLHGWEMSAGHFYHGTGRSTATTSFYASAVNKGYRVLGLTHRSSRNVRIDCGDNLKCHLPTHRTLITGKFQQGSAETVTDMDYDDGIEARLIQLLVFLRDTQDPTGGWDAYLTPSHCTGTGNASTACGIVWNKLIVAGHSQGAGHAVVIGRDHPVDTVVMVAGPTVPADTLFSSGLETQKGGGNYRGLVHTGDPLSEAATAHWDSTRLDTGDYGKRTSLTDPRCGDNPLNKFHNCVIESDLFYSIWQELWP